ncbi:MAG: GGDEF domain-containing protein [Clostridia bacterium]|nr:GGDEF domain-containing protein [Clostridia bacterium]
MSDRNAEILFEYLRSILYDNKVKSPDINALDESFRKLGMGLMYLEKAIAQLKAYSADLSKGNLSCEAPPRDNPLCENLKGIHANLNHLTWQAKQVAKGDYSQTVSYLGEFSEAFNTMTRQLEERENQLKEEAQREKELVDMLNVYNHELEHEANSDNLTGVGNRHFFLMKMSEMIKNGDRMILCYCDLDHLKFINDRYGHAAGDEYIRGFANIIKTQIRSHDVFARMGGDEFCILLKDCPLNVAESKIEKIQHIFSLNGTDEYPRSFSCGIIEVPENSDCNNLEELLNRADELMYSQKEKHHNA